MSADCYRFEDTTSAFVWLVGIRALTGTEHPTCIESLVWKLVDDGDAIHLRVETKTGFARCIAQLPRRLTEDEARKCEWFGSEDNLLRSMPTMGNAWTTHRT